MSYSRLESVLAKAALDPAAWPDACDAIAELLGATGTLLLSENADERSLIMPHSRDLTDALRAYMSGGWYRDDLRARGFPKAMRRGFVLDQDLISIEEMRSHPYYNVLLAPFGLKWFIGTTLQAGGRTWGVAVHGSRRRGPFDEKDGALLVGAKSMIERAARSSVALGLQRVAVVEDVLKAGGKGSAILARSGKILVSNEIAERLLAGSGLVVGGRLQSRDSATERTLERLRARLLFYDAAAVGTGPITLPGPAGQVLSLDLIQMPRDFGTVFTGAYAFLTVQELVAPGLHDPDRLVLDWRLTRREAELASYLLAGLQLAQASEAMKLSVGTARQYLKSIFRKTGCSRQAELMLKLSVRKS